MLVCISAICAIILIALLGVAIFPLYISIRNLVKRMIWATSLNKLSLKKLRHEKHVINEQKREGEAEARFGATNKNASIEGMLGGFKVSDAEARMKIVERHISKRKEELNQ
jgi:hypothetical protein